jgi:hypothetical protein
MPRRSKKVLEAREKKAQEQFLTLLCMTPSTLSEEDLRQAEQEIARIESMTDEELHAYYQSPDGLAVIAEYREQERELEELEATPIEQRPNPLGRKLIRHGKLEFYQKIHARVMAGVPRKQIAEELDISVNTLKIALRTLRKLTGDDYETHKKTHRHQSWSDTTKCPQCRAHINEGHNVFGEDKRRVQRQKREVPISQLDKSEDNLHYWNIKQTGNHGTSSHGVGVLLDEDENENENTGC